MQCLMYCSILIYFQVLYIEMKGISQPVWFGRLAGSAVHVLCPFPSKAIVNQTFLIHTQCCYVFQ